MEEITAELRHYSKMGPEDRCCYWGQIYNDTKGRFQDGTVIKTSRVISVDGDIVRTKNASYRLIED